MLLVAGSVASAFVKNFDDLGSTCWQQKIVGPTTTTTSAAPATCQAIVSMRRTRQKPCNTFYEQFLLFFSPFSPFCICLLSAVVYFVAVAVVCPWCLFLPHFSATASAKLPAAASLSHTRTQNVIYAAFLGQPNKIKQTAKFRIQQPQPSTCDLWRTLQHQCCRCCCKSLSLPRRRHSARRPRTTTTVGCK